MVRYIENKWSCDECEATNLGRYTTCQSCGSAKSAVEASKERMDRSATVTDPTLLKQAREGAHWECGYCGGKQRAPDGNCQNCGSRKEAEKPKFPSNRTMPEYDFSGGVRGKYADPPPAPPPVPKIESYEVDPKSGTIRAPKKVSEPLDARGFVGVGLISSFVLAIFLGMYFLFRTEEFTGRVTSTKWIHTVSYEERMTHRGEGWNLPSGAFDVDSQRKWYGTENCRPYDCNPYNEEYDCRPHKCGCHEVCRDQGNGFSRCDDVCNTCYDTCTRKKWKTCYHKCDVYKQWHTYKYYRWEGRGSRTLDGTNPALMDWPDPGTVDETHRSTRAGAYLVNFVDTDDPKEKFADAPDSATEFARFREGQVWKCERAVVGRFQPVELVKE